MRTRRRKFLTFNVTATDPLLPEQPRSRSRYPLTAQKVGLIALTGAVIGFVMGVALAVTVHFLTQ